jgi:hypothetical protein
MNKEAKSVKEDFVFVNADGETELKIDDLDSDTNYCIFCTSTDDYLLWPTLQNISESNPTLVDCDTTKKSDDDDSSDSDSSSDSSALFLSSNMTALVLMMIAIIFN